LLVIVSNQSDHAARELAARWAAAGQDVRLLTPHDLSLCGWRHYLGGSGPARAVVEGCNVETAEIAGVLTRMPSVFEQELTEIVPEDRSYVAAEMTAFLLSWLSGLSCPVINHPTAACLAGPYWRQERWTRAAHDLGIPVHPLRRSIRLAASQIKIPAVRRVSLVVVGEHVYGTGSPELACQARRLAQGADCDLMAVEFEWYGQTARFIGAHPWPELATPELAGAALLHLLDSGRRTPSLGGAT
jgi:hypothetical protein